MSGNPFFQFYPSDWLAGTRGLTSSETGVYITLIALMYEANGPIQFDEKRLARLCGATAAAFKKAVDGLVETGKLSVSEDGIFNRRVQIEIEKRSEKRALARVAGIASGRSRNDKNAELRKLRMRDARSKGTHTPIQWEALTQSLGNKCVKCGAAGPCEKDHIVPVYQGGSDGIDNLQPLCRACNAGKGPNSDDLRPQNWKVAYLETLIELSEKSQEIQGIEATDVGRALNERSTNQKPEPDIVKEEPNGSSKRRGTRLPDEWMPDEAFARQEGLSASDCMKEADKFRDYWKGQPGQRGVKTDWAATWRNWVRKSAERLPKPESREDREWKRIEADIYRNVL